MSPRLHPKLYRVGGVGILSLLLCSSCGVGKGKDKNEARPQVSDASARTKPSTPPAKALAKPPARFQDNGDEAGALAKQGALPAWSLVLERYRLLARRDQSGVAFGLVVQHEGNLRLVDETLGGGSLSIPIELPESVVLAPPARVLLWGAWHMAAGGDFVWRATRVEVLSSKPTAPEFAPGLVARERDAPNRLSPPSTITRAGGALVFKVHGREERPGDGWLIADGAEGPPIARLLLPGEQGSYGDQSRLTDSERWKLKKKGLYWAQIRRFRPSTGGRLPVLRAKTPPFHYSPSKPPASEDTAD